MEVPPPQITAPVAPPETPKPIIKIGKPTQPVIAAGSIEQEAPPTSVKEWLVGKAKKAKNALLGVVASITFAILSELLNPPEQRG